MNVRFKTTSVRVGTLCSALLIGVLVASGAHAGAFIFAGESNGVDMVCHPSGYTGSGTHLTISLCIDPTSANAADMVIPVQNIATTINGLSAVSPNLISGGSNNIPGSQIDFESVALHEVGHCIGLAHPNLGSQSGVSNTNSTNTTNGSNNSFEENSGSDGIFGSADDTRGDDVNLTWFRMADNNPFIKGSTFDSTVYSRDLGDLPGGDVFSANADRTVASLYGVSSTEAVMQQGSFFDEDQRDWAADDEAMLRYAMSGVDEVQGNSDDYTISAEYVGMTTDCDVVLRYNNSATGFAVCNVSGSFVGSGHIRITAATASFNTGFDWFFNDEVKVLGIIFSDGFESGNTNEWSSVNTLQAGSEPTPASAE